LKKLIIERLPESSDLLISILPVHAKRIYSGKKTFELRKVIPKELPRRIFLYETEKSEVTGHIVVEKILSGPPVEIWGRTRDRGTTKERFFRYFSGKKVAHAFQISCAVKYKESIRYRDEKGESYPTPQSFLYVQSFPALSRLLRGRALLESLASIPEPFRFRPIQRSNEREFVRLVRKHISLSYSETGEKYARKLLELHKSGEDVEGVFSLRKTILEVLRRGKLRAFCVLTEKVGGSVKTGPVVFQKEYVGKGNGKKLRAQLHKSLRLSGFRKVYCTAPAVNAGAISYLLGSGYRIEAHLQRQYHSDHNEFVFGYSLVKERSAAKETVRRSIAAEKISKVTNETPDAKLFLQQEFQAAFCALPSDWAARQLKYALASTDKSSQFKPRQIFSARSSEDLLCIALCLSKRGGGTKILIATRTDHIETLGRLISEIEADAVRLGSTRKLYSLVPTLDATLQRAYFQAGFAPEGLLDRPYRSSDDLIIFSKKVVT
jgi:predicted transcriptional regulator